MEIVHISTDEKFINAANKTFEKLFPGQNLFLVFNPEDRELTHIKLQVNVKTITPETIDGFANEIKKAQLVFFHSYLPKMDIVFNYVSKKATLIWFCFGMEIYNDPKLYSRNKLLDEISFTLFPPQRKAFSKEVKDYLRPYVRKFKKNLPLSKVEVKIDKLNRFDYIAAVYEEEFEFIKSKIKSNAKWLQFCYFSLQYMVDLDDNSLNNKKDNFFIGNSGHITNNHLDVFKRLQDVGLQKQKVICPLGYGNQEYIDLVIKEGISLFDKKFIPITSFLPLDEYKGYLKSIKVAIFDARRQQGVGTIIPIIWYGAKVFLSKRNTFYKYLKRIGIHVYCYESDLNQKTISTGLSKEQILHNRKILYDNFNEKYLLSELERQLNHIISQ